MWCDISREESRHITLANHHKAFVQIEKRAGHIVRFAVQVVRLTDGKIQEVYRADNCHGHPHEHTWIRGRARVNPMRVPTEDLTAALDVAWRKAQEVAHADDPTRRSR